MKTTEYNSMSDQELDSAIQAIDPVYYTESVISRMSRMAKIELLLDLDFNYEQNKYKP